MNQTTNELRALIEATLSILHDIDDTGDGPNTADKHRWCVKQSRRAIQLLDDALARDEQAQGGMAVEYVYRDKTGEAADQVSRYPFPLAWSDRWELVHARPTADARQETQG